MCFNFSRLKASILLSPVTCDGYEADNLISEDGSKRRQGCLCESFVKPPVEIAFNFFCELELHCIRVCGKVGAQHSVGFELYSYVKTARTSKSSTQTASKKEPPGPSEFYLIGKAFANSNEDNFIFVNRNFRPRNGSCECNIPTSDSRTCVRNIGHHVYRAMCDARGIKLRILRTANGTIPCIGKLEVWAQPSRTVNGQTLCQLQKLTLEPQQKLPSRVCGNPTSTSCGKNRSKPTEKHEDLFKQDKDVPIEFLDPITNEIMISPILLPSGNTVDQATLDKYHAAEESWGRGASDPFTGLAFRTGRNPIPDTGLKSRIDSFLLTHEQIAKNVGRTLGKNFNFRSKYFGNAPGEAVPSSLIKVCPTKANGVFPVSSDDNSKSSASKAIKRRRTNDESATTTSDHPIVFNHEERVKASLDSSLKTVLQSLKSYTKKSDDVKDSKICRTCSVEAVAYRLPCWHEICRACLVKKVARDASAACSECNVVFNKDEPIRIHM